MNYIGIDPGKKGAIACVSDYGVSFICHAKSTLQEQSKWLKERRNGFAMIEKVGAMPGNGGTSMFQFGLSAGQSEGLVVGAEIAYEMIIPRKWQKEFGLLARTSKSGVKESKTLKKNRHKEMAARLFPSIEVTKDNADALLIAEYCKRLKTGTLSN